MLLLLIFYMFWEKFSLCSSDWPQNHYSPVSASRERELQVCPTILALVLLFIVANLLLCLICKLDFIINM
jgi:hypothetical protein